MKKASLITLSLLALLVSCGSNAKYNEQSQDAMSPASPMAPADVAYAESEAAGNGAGYNAMTSSADGLVAADSISSIMSSSAAKGAPDLDSNYQFIRTADARFRVDDVRKATFAVEKLTAHYGGYVAHTGLVSNIDREARTQVSDDSTLITTYYTVSNDLVLRVPAENLDSTLRALGALARYLDSRTIDRQNATLMVLRERLAARRIGYTQRRLEDAVDDGQAKLRDRAAVEEALFNKQTAADESYLRTLELKDQIRLSTISVHMYQRQAWTHEMVANEHNIDAYKPGFWKRAGEALENGWNGLISFLVGLLNFWPLLLVVALLIGVALWLSRRKPKA